MGIAVIWRSLGRHFGVAAFGLLLAAIALAFPAAAGAHPERESFFPPGYPDAGDFPEYRTDGKSYVVCKADSLRRIRLLEDPSVRRRNLRLIKQCRFRHIQRAVNESGNNQRILVLPGVYNEEPSKLGPPAGCEAIYAKNDARQTLTYEEHLQCPNVNGLISVLGDTNGNRICDSKCNLQIEGTGEDPGDVVINGNRIKGNIIRLDRADGAYITNLTAELSEDNNMYAIETNGFVWDRIVSRYSQNYAFLSFTSDHGIYSYCTASHSGDSGVYPGSGPDARHGQPDANGDVYGIIIHHCDSHDNTIGYSGTAGNGVWAHHNRFYNNSAGITTDSFASGHPGMPQDNSKWTNNLVYSNNVNIFSDDRDEYCQNTPWEERTDPTLVCPTFQVPVGTGMLIAGGNDNIVEDNYFFDNWRRGTMLIWVPSTLRGEQDPLRNYDTSVNNRYAGNCMSIRPPVLDPDQVDWNSCPGTTDRNGTDFWWDEEEGLDCDSEQPGCTELPAGNAKGNCWGGNTGANGAPTSDPLPALLPACPGIDLFRPGNSAKQVTTVPCATWTEHDDPETPIDENDPPGCDWFTTPSEP
jgi:hypothetical protein